MSLRFLDVLHAPNTYLYIIYEKQAEGIAGFHLPLYFAMKYSMVIVIIILFDDVYSIMFYFFKKIRVYMFVHSYNINGTLQ